MAPPKLSAKDKTMAGDIISKKLPMIVEMKFKLSIKSSKKSLIIALNSASINLLLICIVIIMKLSASRINTVKNIGFRRL